MIQTLDLRSHDVARGAVLRHAESLFDQPTLRYDPEHEAGLNTIILGEIDEPVTRGAVDLRADGLERVFLREGRLILTRDAFPKGLIAIPVGNRYALKCILGGLQNPIDGSPNGSVVGGTTLTNLTCGNVAGFVNRCWPPGRPLTSIRVLGAVVDEAGRPVSLRDFVPQPLRHAGPAPHGVLVAGAGMETGKTTFCVSFFRVLREAGREVTYHKATGTSCFLGDPLRVQTGDMSVLESWGDELSLDPHDMRVSDFTDACGVPSDASLDLSAFVDGTCRFLGGQAGDVCVVEFADSVHHRTNAGLLHSPAFRSYFRRLVYVVDPSLDAARNFIHYIRDVLHWDDVQLAFTGALATDPYHEALRAEIHARFGVPILDASDPGALRAWGEAESGALI